MACTLTTMTMLLVTECSLVEQLGIAQEVCLESVPRLCVQPDFLRILFTFLTKCVLLFPLFAGVTPWGTFVSCEEYGNGQCWQVDPDPSGAHYLNPKMTKLGGKGGNYEVCHLAGAPDGASARPASTSANLMMMGIVCRLR